MDPQEIVVTTLEPTRPTPALPSADDLVAGPGRRTARLPRPFAIVTGGGMSGVLTLVTALSDFGYRVPDFSVDVHEGVACSDIACTIALAGTESADFLACVRSVPGVLSAEPA